METKEIWDFILRQFKRCEMLLENKDYRGAIDLIYDIADNISNLYKYIEEGNITSDKGKLLNNLSLMFRKGIFREDFGLLLREKQGLRNLAKYGYFASSKIDIKDVEIPEDEIKKLFGAIKKMFSEFEKYMEDRHA